MEITLKLRLEPGRVRVTAIKPITDCLKPYKSWTKCRSRCGITGKLFAVGDSITLVQYMAHGRLMSVGCLTQVLCDEIENLSLVQGA